MFSAAVLVADRVAEEAAAGIPDMFRATREDTSKSDRKASDESQLETVIFVVLMIDNGLFLWFVFALSTLFFCLDLSISDFRFTNTNTNYQ
mmetsp:Transcript_8142/g.20180  ORF Transcript_8142/g.20180 Transcript_8142/m.20180 type:complete len:91 (-) Transcript_8142:87-359(-)